MAYFRDRSDIELDALTDEEIVGQMLSAREHGHADAERRAQDVLAWRLGMALESRLRLRLRGESDGAIEEIRDAILRSLLETEFKGETIGEVRSLANQVFARRIADHYRRKRPPTTGLADEHSDDDEPFGAVVLEQDETGAVEVRMVVDEVLAGRNPIHVRVINLWLQGQPSKQIGRTVDAEYAGEPGTPMSPANVDQIKRRFRNDVATAMDGGFS